MAGKKKKAGYYYTFRLECKKTVVVTTKGTVDVKIPRGNQRRIRNGKYKPSLFAEFLNASNCIEWGKGEESYPTELVTDVELLSDSDQAYRCRWNRDTKKWEFEFGEEPSSQ
jgi:hypothetical protein